MKSPFGQEEMKPGTRVQVSIDGGEWQEQVVQPASYADGSDGGGRFTLPDTAKARLQ